MVCSTRGDLPFALAERYAHQMLEEDDDEGSFDEDRESDSEEEGEESDFSVSGEDSDEEDRGGEATTLRCWCACLRQAALGRPPGCRGVAGVWSQGITADSQWCRRHGG